MNYADARDWLFLEDLDGDGREATGLEVYKQEIWHRLNSRRGSLEGSAGDGIDLLEFQHLETDTRARSEIETLVRNECAKDQRTTGCVVRAEFGADRSITIRIKLQTNDGDLTLIAAVGRVNTELLKG